MKNLFVLILLTGSLSCYSQNINGFYTGILQNDSSGMIQKYELAIAMYKGKVSGYSYVTFISNDTFYYGIRKVKGSIVGDSLVIRDDKFVANNFPETPAKGVRRTIVLPLNGQDSVISLSGSWKTNRTRRYYSVPGKIELERSADSANSPLINHLKELDIIPREHYTARTETASNTRQDAPPNEDRRQKAKPAADPDMKGTVPLKIPYDQRKTGSQKSIEVYADSLVLAFYDNGVVDGDSISVYMNGLPIVSNAKLTTGATKKTIAIPGDEEVQLLLVAENLGTIPPNTGLLTIKDGDEVYQVHFSADMQTNASIVIKRKKK